MKSIIKINFLLIFIVLISFTLFAEIKKSDFHGLKTGMDRKEVAEVLRKGEYGCGFFDDTVICTEFHDSAVMLSFKGQILDSIIAKYDISDIDLTFNEKLKEMSAIYGKPQRFEKEKNFALFFDDEKPGAIKASRSSSGTGLFFYIFCNDKDCKELKEYEE